MYDNRFNSYETSSKAAILVIEFLFIHLLFEFERSHPPKAVHSECLL